MPAKREQEEEYYEGDMDAVCTWCAGDGIVETNDPLWDGHNAWIRCPACAGTGLRRHQAIF